VDTSRIHGPTAPAQRVQGTRNDARERKDEEAPEFQVEGVEERRPEPEPEQERERGEVAPRSEDESGGRLDVIA